MSVRKVSKPLAYVLSLFVLGAAVALPQSLTGNANTPGGGATYPVSDETFKVCDDGDTTKCFQLENSGITTANTVVPFTLGGTAAAPTITIPNGTSAAPSLNFANSTTTGFYSRAGTAIDIAAGGAEVFNFQAGIGYGISTFQFGWSSGALGAGADTGLERISAGRVGVTDGSTGDGSFHVPLKLSYGGGTTITVDGATTFAATSSYHILACTGAETINTITGGVLGMQLVLLSNDADCTIADDDTATAANAVNLTGTATNDVGAAGKHLTLLFDGNAWQQIAESANN